VIEALGNAQFASKLFPLLNSSLPVFWLGLVTGNRDQCPHHFFDSIHLFLFMERDYSFFRFSFLFARSKTALLEGLEIDQYLWGILNTLSSNSSSASDAEEVTIDSAANWRPVNQKLMSASVKTEDDGGQETSCHGSKRAKVMSPGSVTLPTMPNWDLGQSLSPFCPPDMNSKDFTSFLGQQLSLNCRL
jgi:hypothetical protein